MDLLDQLRALLPVIDPGLLTAQDRIALLDLFERASVRDSSAA
jgi:hypothetical protein